MNLATRRSRASRDPDKTRERILTAAYEQIHQRGYQGMRLDEILEVSRLTKGALYHHFPNKQALGYAVVEEIIQPMIETLWVDPILTSSDPFDALIEVIESLPGDETKKIVEFGCPLNNLIQEMAPIDEGFRARLDKLVRLWHDGTRQALERAAASGRVRAEIDCETTAAFVQAAIEGCIGVAKCSQSTDRLATCLRGIVDYLHSLETA
jgi:AcrR family transcriptional regulator